MLTGFLISVILGFGLSGCSTPSEATTSTDISPAAPEGSSSPALPTDEVINTPTPSSTPTETPAATVEADKPHFDLSGATLVHPIDPNCVDQFPQAIEAGQSNVVCFTFDNWIIANTPGQYPLAGGYEMLAGAEGWVHQDGQNIPVIIPLATASQENGELQINDGLVQDDLEDYWYKAIEAAWETLTELKPGDTLWVILAMPSANLASNSTQGFGFEATPYTEDELDELLTTGDFEILGNALWPVIDIDGRAAQQ